MILLRELIFFISLFGLSKAGVPELALKNMTQTVVELGEDDYAKPEYFNTSNNLRRLTGSPFIAEGEFLSINGRIVDLFDQPLEGVIVNIWHANTDGVYNEVLGGLNANKYDYDFAGNGTSITDSLGYYSFTTIMPGSYDSRAPHVHFNIKYNNMQFETEMFFPKHPYNKLDAKYKSLKSHQIPLVVCKIAPLDSKKAINGKIAQFDMRLNVVSPFGSY